MQYDLQEDTTQALGTMSRFQIGIKTRHHGHYNMALIKYLMKSVRLYISMHDLQIIRDRAPQPNERETLSLLPNRNAKSDSSP